MLLEGICVRSGVCEIMILDSEGLECVDSLTSIIWYSKQELVWF